MNPTSLLVEGEKIVSFLLSHIEQNAKVNQVLALVNSQPQDGSAATQLASQIKAILG